MKNDTFTLGGKEFSSRFILGSGKYSMELIKAAVENAGAQIITLAVRRTNTHNHFLRPCYRSGIVKIAFQKQNNHNRFF